MNTSWKLLAHFLAASLALVSLPPASSRAQSLNGRYTIRMDSATVLSIHGTSSSGLVRTRRGD